jgi:hypothetical protein
MKVPYDVVLPRLNVLGSTMAYREREIPKRRSRFFCTGTPPRRTYSGISFRWLRRQHIASHPISSGSANQENLTSSIGLLIMFATSMRSSLTQESRQHSS